MSTTAARTWTLEEYLAFEEQSEERHEFLDGEVRPMTGGSVSHNDISQNLNWELSNRLGKGSYRIYTHGMRVVCPTGLWTYPDVFVVAGKTGRDGTKKHTITNPTLIVEVLSPSTEQYDRGEKFEHYQSIESLREYLLVAQDRVRVELFRRGTSGDEWPQTEFDSRTHSVELRSLNVELPLRHIYQDIVLPNEPHPEAEEG